jgi:hypothetical protein
VFSDYLTGAFTPGSLDVNASIETGPYPVRATGTVTLQSTADATAALTEALNGPNGAQVLAQFVTDLQFRLAHNPMFTHAFYVAILQALRTG